MVMEGIQEDMGEGNMLCTNHPYKNTTPGGICAFCLQEKLGKLRRKKKSNDGGGVSGSDSTAAVFKRSKSTATPRNRLNLLEVERNGGEYSPHKRGFWGASREKKKEEFVAVEENDESPDDQASSFDRKVSRSRSVGCGSRSFSGDFFERISTGFGDCTLRRVESQREGKPKVHHRTSGASGQDCIKERVRCENVNGNGKPVGHHQQLAHGRSRSWGWAFASPMRAFTKTSSGKREASSSNKNTTPNLAAIPSLLTARG
nr:uncharacterized protein DDB_G0271670-like [Ipomoea batatas]